MKLVLAEKRRLYAGSVPELVSVIQQSFHIQLDVPAPVNAAQVINSKKVTDHHAIIPTKTAAGYDISSLLSGESLKSFGLL